MKTKSSNNYISSKLNENSKKESIILNTKDKKISEHLEKGIENKNIENIKEIIANNNINNDMNNYKTNYITLRYKITPGTTFIKIFGTDFVINNKDNCKIIHKNKIYKLMDYFEINEYNKNKNNDILEIKLLGINNITDLSYMFSNCVSLISLPDIFKLDTSKCTKMSYMFNNCSSLLSLPDISNWNISNIIYMDGIFKSCKSLLYLPDISKWETSKVINMSYLFCNCESLTILPDISKWDITNITDMSCMFMHCKLLIKLPDISEWNKSNNIDMTYLFYNCTSLEFLPKLCEFQAIDGKYNIFENCINLVKN